MVDAADSDGRDCPVAQFHDGNRAIQCLAGSIAGDETVTVPYLSGIDPHDSPRRDDTRALQARRWHTGDPRHQPGDLEVVLAD